MDLNHAGLVSVCVEIIDGIPGSLSTGTHNNDDFLRIGSSIVVKQLIVTTSQLINLIHTMLDDAGDGGNFLVSPLTALEKDIRIDGCAASGGMLRVQSVFAKSIELVLIHQFRKILIIQRFNALHLMRGAETVKTMHKGIAAIDSGQMRNSA